MVTIVKKIMVRFIFVLVMIVGFSKVSYGIIQITSPETWANPQYVYEDVEILDGGILTIASEIAFNPENSIKVYPGGKLIVNGGRLTNHISDQLWQGIVVVGNKGLSQNYSNQGTVILNDAHIENAVCGIMVGLRHVQQINDGYTVSFLGGGGIVEAENSKFINNMEAIHFNDYIYRNSYNYNEVNNKSSFINCEFIVNNEALFSDYNAMVYLTGVRGVSFKGCNFSDQISDIECCGIYANDAGFSLNLKDPFGSPIDANYHPDICSFSGFSHAISIINSNSKGVNILNTYFSNNEYNVYVDCTPNVRIESCYLTGTSNTAANLLFNQSTAYKIANNVFDGGDIGIFLCGTVLDNNFIHTITFQNITCKAIMVGGIQGIKDPIIQGLKIFCNVFESNQFDIYIDNGSSICPEQGVFNKKTAGNHFGPNVSSFNIYNDPTNPMLMYCYDGSVPYEHPPYVNSNVSLNNNAKYSECRDVGYMGDLYYHDLNIGTSYEIDQMYNILKDKFEILISEYEMQYPESIDWTSFYEGDTSFQQQVDDFIVISLLKDSMDNLCINAIQVLLSENELNKNDFKLWISRLQSPIMDFLLAQCYLDENDLDLMNATLDDMLTLYMDYLPSDILNTKICLNYLGEWNFDDNDSAYISQSAIDSLSIIASDSGISSSIASAILDKIFGNITFNTYDYSCPEIPDYQAPLRIDNSVKNNIIVIPNPANDLISINCENYVIKNISLYDMYGKKILSMELDTYSYDMNISNISKGFYFLRCQMQDGKSITKKIIKK
ncbi:MAG: T9SS type A sorting domain-containing protein [Bacteroidales bacterium]|nr:T9SS type A sorting domain-containing protein [Bacteroidales bacterium]